MHIDRRRRRSMSAQMLTHVGIDPSRLGERPGRFSGGQLQRVAIARALVARSTVLVCDEPTSALDVSVQAQILNLLQDLQEEIGFSCIFVTHDLAVAQVVADDVLVLRRGRVEEAADAATFFSGPSQAYSRALLEATAGRRAAEGASVSPGRAATACAAGTMQVRLEEGRRR